VVKCRERAVVLCRDPSNGQLFINPATDEVVAVRVHAPVRVIFPKEYLGQTVWG
jgi:hypothetical protein